MGNGAIPTELRRLKEMVVNRPEEEVYAILKEICNMDAVNRLLSQDPFPPELVVDAPVQVSMAYNASVDDAPNIHQSEASSVLQSLKEIVNLPEEEISATLKECNMDPDHALDRLLCQDPFQEVKSKREKKKEILQGKDNSRLKSRGATNSSNQGRNSGAKWHHGERAASASCYTSRPPLHGRSTYMKEKGPGPYTSFVSGVTGCDRSRGNPGLVDNATVGTGGKGSVKRGANDKSPVSRRFSAHQPYMVKVPGQVSMAENVRRGKTNKKESNAPNASHHSVDGRPIDDAPKIDQSEVSLNPTKDKWPSIEKTPAAASHVVCGVEKIAEEQTMNILSRLTAIDLVRCKAVCKSWNSLISSREFVYEHLKCTKSEPSSHHLLVSNDLVFDLDKELPGPFNSVACFSSLDMVIVGSVNGLVCMAGKTLNSPKSADDIWILNPATCLSRQLPLPSKSRLTDKTETVLFAFWFDEVTDGGVYKVAKLVSMADGLSKLEVWVSNSPDTWREVTTLNFRFHPTLCLLRDCDVLIEGFGAYWIVADYDEDVCVLCLDLKTLALKLLPLSEGLKHMPVKRDWVVRGIQNNVLFGAKFHGHFVLIQNGLSDDGTFYIWTMSMDGGEFRGWNRSYRLILDFIFEGCLGWCINEKLVLESHRNVLTLLDMVTGKDEYLGVDGDMKEIFLNSVHDIVGSLVSIEGFKRNDLYDLDFGFSWPRDYPYGWGRACKKTF